MFYLLCFEAARASLLASHKLAASPQDESDGDDDDTYALLEEFKELQLLDDYKQALRDAAAR